MSEHHAPDLTQPELKAGPEQHLLETEPSPQSQLEQAQTVAEHETNRLQTLEASRQTIESTAQSIEDHKTTENVAEKNDTTYAPVNNELKEMSRERLLQRVQRQLPTSSKMLSKITHQPIVDTLSQVSEKTIARPSGLLGGSIAALFGSITLLYLSKHYGYSYNFLAFAAVFTIGFALGIATELALKLRHKS